MLKFLFNFPDLRIKSNQYSIQFPSAPELSAEIFFLLSFPQKYDRSLLQENCRYRIWEWAEKNSVKFCPNVRRAEIRRRGHNMFAYIGIIGTIAEGAEETTKNLSQYPLLEREIYGNSLDFNFRFNFWTFAVSLALFYIFYIILSWFQEIDPVKWIARIDILVMLFLIFSPLIEVLLLIEVPISCD
ncbi:unnamed protein product [Blepharisma stoltei]|uniref:Uncharacterized protein n=1 Tax=Blepharisma stoltei TaxID=1481888 RepID=A0AAU9IMZ7_9CILI|nr:unnamed protein product [Blepharisma stoltei]